MKTILSPAKSLNFEEDLRIGAATQPEFMEESAKVARKMAGLSAPKLMKLQKISAPLAKLNRQRNLEWSAENWSKGKQAALAFTGDVYQGMEAWNWSEEDMSFASQQILILSGMYGLLQPNTLIQPYRLEMGTPLPIGRKKNLYEFWQAPLKSHLKETLDAQEIIVNLASKEYAQVLKQLKLPNKFIDVEFLDWSKGEYKVLSFFAKKARGLMANFIVQHRITDWQELKDFNLAGYYLYTARSANEKLVFLRDQQWRTAWNTPFYFWPWSLPFRYKLKPKEQSIMSLAPE